MSESIEDSDNINTNNDVTLDLEVSENKNDNRHVDNNDDSIICIDRQQYEDSNIQNKRR